MRLRSKVSLSKVYGLVAKFYIEYEYDVMFIQCNASDINMNSKLVCDWVF